jgi:hypothetical protein
MTRIFSPDVFLFTRGAFPKSLQFQEFKFGAPRALKIT